MFGHTWKACKIGTTFSNSADSVHFKPLKVTPRSNIFQSFIELTIFHVFSTDQACSPGGIHQVLKLNAAGGLVFANPGSRDWLSKMGLLATLLLIQTECLRKFNRLDLDPVEGPRATFSGMFKHEVIALRSVHVPCVLTMLKKV